MYATRTDLIGTPRIVRVPVASRFGFGSRLSVESSAGPSPFSSSFRSVRVACPIKSFLFPHTCMLLVCLSLAFSGGCAVRRSALPPSAPSRRRLAPPFRIHVCAASMRWPCSRAWRLACASFRELARWRSGSIAAWLHVVCTAAACCRSSMPSSPFPRSVRVLASHCRSRAACARAPPSLLLAARPPFRARCACSPLIVARVLCVLALRPPSCSPQPSVSWRPGNTAAWQQVHHSLQLLGASMY